MLAEAASEGGATSSTFWIRETTYGIDLSEVLLATGYDVELARLELQHKLPRENLRATDDFDATSFGVTFDAVLALSVFTHLPINHVRLCLARLEGQVRVGGKFYATIFRFPDGDDWSQPLHQGIGGITTYPDRDPYHYSRSDLEFCSRGLHWRLEQLEGWNHPRSQWMAVFVRTERP